MVGWNAVLNEAERCADGSIAVGGLTLLENLKPFSRQFGQLHLAAVLQKTDHICGETPVYSQASTAQKPVTALTKELIFIYI